MNIDFDLLDGAIEDAETEAGGYRHMQSTWANVVDWRAPSAEMCGTGLCLFGFVAVRCGVKPPVPVQVQYGSGPEWSIPSWYVNPETGETVPDWTEGMVHVAKFARDQLGLTALQASALSSAYNTLGDIRRMRDELREDPSATLEKTCGCGCDGDHYRDNDDYDY